MSRLNRWNALLVTTTCIVGAIIVAGCPSGNTSDPNSAPPPPSGGGSGDSGSGGEAAVVEATLQIAATGQTTSYRDDDDGDLQLGESMAAAQRFTNNGDGTITDELTGLMWLRDASCLIHNYEEWETDGWAEGWVPWARAFLFIEQINDGTLSACAAGYGDWRLPNVVELESLVNAEEVTIFDWLNAVGFVGVEQQDYWTSTTDPDTITTFAYTVNMDDGTVSRLGNKVTAPAITSVWPVRGDTTGAAAELWKTGQTTSYIDEDDGDLEEGVAWPSPRFTDNGDGTVTDHLTGLMWLQDAHCIGITANWNEAHIAAAHFNTTPGDFTCDDYTATHADWRVPNRKEFLSLFDYSRETPALIDGHPFVDVSENASYWSSTTSAADATRAWHGDLRSGEIGLDYKANGHRVTLVRTP